MNPFRSSDVAVDVGTATMRATTFTGDFCEQTSVCRNTPALIEGVIADPDASVGILKSLLRTFRSSRITRPRVLACAPTDASGVERAALKNCLLRAGASAVVIVPEPLAAAVGAGIDIASGYSKLVVDFGEGVTDCALIHRGRVIQSKAVRVGCANLRKFIQSWATDGLQVKITEAEADRLLRAYGIGSEQKAGESGSPMAASAEFVRKAIDVPLSRMLENLTAMIRNLPPALGAEVIEDGIFLTGGGALLPGMSARVESLTGIHTTIAPQPLASVIHGARAMLPLAATLKLWR